MARRQVGEIQSRESRKAEYQVAAHRLLLRGRPGIWNVDVDESSLPMSYATQAEAWEAGVREADRRDRLAAAADGPSGAA